MASQPPENSNLSNVILASDYAGFSPEIRADYRHLEETRGVYPLVNPDTEDMFYLKRSNEQVAELFDKIQEAQLPEDAVLVPPKKAGELNDLPESIQQKFTEGNRPGFESSFISEAIPDTLALGEGMSNPDKFMDVLDGQHMTQQDMNTLKRDVGILNEQGIYHRDYLSNLFISRDDTGQTRFYSIDYEPEAFQSNYGPEEDISHLNRAEQAMKQTGLIVDNEAQLNPNAPAVEPYKSAQMRINETNGRWDVSTNNFGETVSRIGLEGMSGPDIKNLERALEDAGHNPQRLSEYSIEMRGTAAEDFLRAQPQASKPQIVDSQNADVVATKPADSPSVSHQDIIADTSSQWKSTLMQNGGMATRIPLEGMSAGQVDSLESALRSEGFDPERRVSSSMGDTIRLRGQDAVAFDKKYNQPAVDAAQQVRSEPVDRPEPDVSTDVDARQSIPVAPDAPSSQTSADVILETAGRWETASLRDGTEAARVPTYGMSESEVSGLRTALEEQGFSPETHRSSELGDTLRVRGTDATQFNQLFPEAEQRSGRVIDPPDANADMDTVDLSVKPNAPAQTVEPLPLNTPAQNMIAETAGQWEIAQMKNGGMMTRMSLDGMSQSEVNELERALQSDGFDPERKYSESLGSETLRLRGHQAAIFGETYTEPDARIKAPGSTDAQTGQIRQDQPQQQPQQQQQSQMDQSQADAMRQTQQSQMEEQSRLQQEFNAHQSSESPAPDAAPSAESGATPNVNSSSPDSGHATDSGHHNAGSGAAHLSAGMSVTGLATGGARLKEGIESGSVGEITMGATEMAMSGAETASELLGKAKTGGIIGASITAVDGLYQTGKVVMEADNVTEALYDGSKTLGSTVADGAANILTVGMAGGAAGILVDRQFERQLEQQSVGDRAMGMVQGTEDLDIAGLASDQLDVFKNDLTATGEAVMSTTPVQLVQDTVTIGATLHDVGEINDELNELYSETDIDESRIAQANPADGPPVTAYENIMGGLIQSGYEFQRDDAGKVIPPDPQDIRENLEGSIQDLQGGMDNKTMGERFDRTFYGTPYQEELLQREAETGLKELEDYEGRYADWKDSQTQDKPQDPAQQTTTNENTTVAQDPEIGATASSPAAFEQSSLSLDGVRPIQTSMPEAGGAYDQMMADGGLQS